MNSAVRNTLKYLNLPARPTLSSPTASRPAAAAAASLYKATAMPRATAASTLPFNGIFPIEKPSGPTSMKVIDDVTLLMLESRLFEDQEMVRHHRHPNGKKKKNTTGLGLKVGQGGTLDPLADGVLVIGVHRGTKHLQQYLMGTKEYESIGILGAATTTMDSEGPVLSTGNFDSITRQDVEKAIENFQGVIDQTPPIFSALKMEGKPLYEYARENKPLPRAIPVRQCTVAVELVDFTPASETPGDGGHTYTWPAEHLDQSEKDVFRRLTSLVTDAQNAQNAQNAQEAQKDGEKDKTTTTHPAMPEIPQVDFPQVSAVTGKRPATFKIRMTVSGGTYVRSIVHDIGVLLGCGAHVVQLRRTRQGRFTLKGDEEELSDAKKKELDTLVQQSTARNEMTRAELEEEAMNSSSPGGIEESMEDPALEYGVKPTGPSTGSVPWSVFEKALEERKQFYASKQLEEDEARANSVSLDEIKKRFAKAVLRRERMDGPLKEWEYEVLRRFIFVPVPISGSTSHKRPNRHY